MNVGQRNALILDNLIIFFGMTFSAIARINLEYNYALDVTHTLDAILTAVIFSVSLYIAGCYKTRHIGAGAEETRRIISGATNALLVIGTLSYLFKHDPNRFVLLIGYAVSTVLILSGRKFLNGRMLMARDNGQMLRKTLILGSPSYANQTTAILKRNPRFGFDAIGRLEIHSEMSYANQRAWLQTIDQAIEEGGVKVLIIEDSEETNQKLVNLLSWHVNQRDVDVLIGISFISALGPRLGLDIHHELPLMYIDEPKLSPINQLVKRTFDIVVAGLATILFSPILLFIAIGVLLSNGRPIIFTQPRIGLAGNEFKFIKFRTMIVGAEQMREDVLGLPDEDMAQRYKTDPRIYPFGRILRRFSLDELPQLFSVIKGDMSLIGPRPLLKEELDLLGDEDHRRHLTKPGLTGLWQVSGRKETSWEERMQMDLQYVHNWSIGLDLGILLRTVKVVLTGHGSY
ncbi:MAG: sugar transferase [Actinobacteria bacterium]|nr:sugar transferase [Actinomycetota bacterium]NBY15191.1 sugar transferase [Actinomycetota bacterium]